MEKQRVLLQQSNFIKVHKYLHHLDLKHIKFVQQTAVHTDRINTNTIALFELRRKKGKKRRRERHKF